MASPSFGDLLREFRVRAGLSQEELAEKARISAAAVGALERGVRRAPHKSTASYLAKALNLNEQEAASLEAVRSAGQTRSTKVALHNLPAERTSFVGRDADVAHVLSLLRRTRLLTVTGSGGVGKTRAVIEAAKRVLGDPWSEVWFVDLAPVGEGGFVPSKIASTMQPPLTGQVDTIADLATALAKRTMLLILDNCEHLVESCASVADAILERCEHVRLLTTSRERLNVEGEFVYRLPSLPREAAIDLFVERAEAAGPPVIFDAKSPAVDDISRQLDGIPLAIELTAAQVPILGLATLRSRLDVHFSVPSRRRDLPARQQTVLATIAWSFDLLTPQERMLLCNVSIFSGGFTLDGAEAVCAQEALLQSEILPLLSALVNKSLVNVGTQATGVRYSILESVRAFGLERLQTAGARDALARRHAQWLAAIGDDVEDTTSALSSERAAELLPEFDNVRAAVAWALGSPEQADRQLAGHIITGLFGLWDRMGRHREHKQLVETALERIDEDRYPLVVSNLLRDFMIRRQPERVALEPIDRAIRLCERSGNQIALARLLNVVAQVQAAHGLLSEAEGASARGLALLSANNRQDSLSYASNLASRSYIRLQQGRYDDARADIAAAEAKALALGYRYTVVRHHYVRRAEIEYAAGNTRLALDLVERMIDSEFGGDGSVAVLALQRIPVLRLLLGDVEGAVEPMRRLLLLSRSGHESFTDIELEYAALALGLLGKLTSAARLWGRVRAQEERVPFRRSAIRRDAHALLVSTLGDQLGDEATRRAIEAGAALERDEAIDEALAALDAK